MEESIYIITQEKNIWIKFLSNYFYSLFWWYVFFIFIFFTFFIWALNNNYFFFVLGLGFDLLTTILFSSSLSLFNSPYCFFFNQHLIFSLISLLQYFPFVVLKMLRNLLLILRYRPFRINRRKKTIVNIKMIIRNFNDLPNPNPIWERVNYLYPKLTKNLSRRNCCILYSNWYWWFW